MYRRLEAIQTRSPIVAGKFRDTGPTVLESARQTVRSGPGLPVSLSGQEENSCQQPTIEDNFRTLPAATGWGGSLWALLPHSRESNTSCGQLAKERGQKIGGECNQSQTTRKGTTSPIQSHTISASFLSLVGNLPIFARITSSARVRYRSPTVPVSLVCMPVFSWPGMPGGNHRQSAVLVWIGLGVLMNE